MKKTILIIGIMTIALLLCGCVKQPQGSEEGAITDATPIPEESGDNATVDGLTQEDLDALKAELENLEYEDLGGLSDS